MDTPPVCPQCGLRVPPDAPLGLCPRCLMNASSSATASFQPVKRQLAAERGTYANRLGRPVSGATRAEARVGRRPQPLREPFRRGFRSPGTNARPGEEGDPVSGGGDPPRQVTGLADRRLPRNREARRGRDGDGLQGEASDLGTRRRLEDSAAVIRSRPGRTPAVSSRIPGHGAD